MPLSPIHRHLQPEAKLKTLFAFVVAVLAGYLFYSGTLFGLILLGAALKLSLREGIEFNLITREYRKIYWFFGLSIGLWKDLPRIEYISVFKTKKKTRSRVITAEATLDFIVYKVNLFYDTNKHLEVYSSDEVKDAMGVAQKISKEWELKIWDATGEEKEWLTI